MGENQVDDKALRRHIADLLSGKGAHADFKQAATGVPAELRGAKPEGAPHSAWELVEHMRIAQWDILEFCRNPKYVSPKWPVGYWPQSAKPQNASAWSKSVRSFQRDLEAMRRLVLSAKTDLFAKIPWGDGQTILREALILADHNAYTIGQIVLIRRLLGAWNNG
jgi:hypothetical protein